MNETNNFFNRKIAHLSWILNDTFQATIHKFCVFYIVVKWLGGREAIYLWRAYRGNTWNFLFSPQQYNRWSLSGVSALKKSSLYFIILYKTLPNTRHFYFWTQIHIIVGVLNLFLNTWPNQMYFILFFTNFHFTLVENSSACCGLNFDATDLPNS